MYTETVVCFRSASSSQLLLIVMIDSAENWLHCSLQHLSWPTQVAKHKGTDRQACVAQAAGAKHGELGRGHLTKLSSLT